VRIAPSVFRGDVASVGVALLCVFLSGSCQTKADPDHLTVSGTIEATETDLGAEVPGLLIERPVVEGEAVGKGQVVARIDPSLYRARLAEARAGQREAEANLALSLKGFRQEEILAALNQVSEMEASLENAEANLRRTEELFSQQVASRFDLDGARRTADVSRARLKSAEENYHKLASGLRTEDIDAARARLEQAQATVEQARLDVQRTEIRAPRPGVVTQTIREPGEYVIVGTPVLSIADLSDMYCWVYLSETELGWVKLGDSVSARIDAYSEHRFSGKVAFLSGEAEFTPRNVQTREERVNLVFAVKISLPNPDGILKVGLPIDVELPIHYRDVQAPPAPSGRP
jgi:membrane fusion protein YbhG